MWGLRAPHYKTMKKIQVIGLPAAGKTTGINLYSDKNLVSIVDIRSFINKKEASFIEQIRRQDTNTIAESACGVDVSGTYIVKLVVERSRLINNLQLRGDKLDKNYIQYLIEQQLPANYIVHNTYDLAEILETIFKS